MILLSELLSKKILNVYSSRIEGVVSNAIYKDKKIIYIQYFDEKEEDYLLDTSKIYSMENDIIVIRNSDSVFPATNLRSENRLIGIDAFNEKGVKLGKIEEVTLFDNWSIKSVKINGEEYDFSRILNINSVAIVKENKNISLATFRPRSKKILGKIKDEQSVKIMPIVDNDEKDNITLVEKFFPKSLNKEGEYKISPSPSPQKVIGIGSGNYLVGRKATKTIYGVNNEIVVKKDTYITSDILNKAKGHNKLMELALYSKSKKEYK